MVRKALEKDVSKIEELLRQVDLVHYNGRKDIFKVGQKYNAEQLKNILKDETKPILVSVDEKDEVLGSVNILYDSEKYISFNLYAPNDVKADNLKGLWKNIWSFISSPTLLVIMGIILIIAVWSILIFNKKKVYKVDKSK